MGILDGKQKRMFSQALEDAYPTPIELERMLNYELDLRLYSLVGREDDMRGQTFKVINYFESRDTTYDLINAARASNPTNAMILRFAQMLGTAIETPGKSDLEAIIGVKQMVDITKWRERIGAIEGQVCRIAAKTGSSVRPLGTGFLVADDCVMTNYHVAQYFLPSGSISPADVICQFDYKRRPNGELVHGKEVTLAADDWNIEARPYAASEAGKGSDPPKSDELDFALLRLSGEPGAEPIGKNDEAPPRGFMRLPTRGEPDFDENKVLFVIQHPQGDPMQLAVNTYERMDDEKLRVFYLTDTQGGSSGSPVFNWNLDLVALHHGWDGKRNRGIPITRISQYLKENGKIEDDGSIAGGDDDWD